MLEYNADTPTSLVEAASPQWFWMEDRFPGADQWNSLHERLVAAWKKQAALLPPGSPLYFAHSAADELGEDLMTVAYLKETAEQAGLDTDWISVEEIGWDFLSGRFVDNQLRFIRSCFKLYRSWTVGGGESVHWHAPNGLGRTGPRRTQPRGGDTHPVRGPSPGGQFPMQPGHMSTARGDGEALNHHSGGAGAPHAGTVSGVPDRTVTLTRSAQGSASPEVDHHTIELNRPYAPLLASS
jgi:hypothetical protein